MVLSTRAGPREIIVTSPPCVSVKLDRLLNRKFVVRIYDPLYPVFNNRFIITDLDLGCCIRRLFNTNCYLHVYCTICIGLREVL